ncbi:hypothetical protein HPB49_010987 [Dermacentor silvarum]|uniref:Uncharacterized protein n=1 Tax=Dermacentor silvarum TaxID=543639 RepID=A0ACB8CWW3_DERSI|nr:hypothetical protein HPB49_010987 [Dermacentor silvarum]
MERLNFHQGIASLYFFVALSINKDRFSIACYRALPAAMDQLEEEWRPPTLDDPWRLQLWPYRPHSPIVWFAQVDAQLYVNGVSSQLWRYLLLKREIPTEVFSRLDLPSSDQKMYEGLKTAFFQHFGVPVPDHLRSMTQFPSTADASEGMAQTTSSSSPSALGERCATARESCAAPTPQEPLCGDNKTTAPPASRSFPDDEQPPATLPAPSTTELVSPLVLSNDHLLRQRLSRGALVACPLSQNTFSVSASTPERHCFDVWPQGCLLGLRCAASENSCPARPAAPLFRWFSSLRPPDFTQVAGRTLLPRTSKAPALNTEPMFTGEVLRNLLTEAIHCISECGLQVVSVVCDCLAANVFNAKLLGCRVHEQSFETLKTFFPHPSNEEHIIFMIFVACHGLKLLRNLLADKGVLLSSTYGVIKVKLAAQTFSSSVSKALEFASVLKLPGLGNCMGTANFIAIVDREGLVTQDGRRMSVIAPAFTLNSVSQLAEKLLDAHLCK